MLSLASYLLWSGLTPNDFILAQILLPKELLGVHVFFSCSLDFTTAAKDCEPALFHKLKIIFKNHVSFKWDIYTNWIFLARCTFYRDFIKTWFLGWFGIVTPQRDSKNLTLADDLLFDVKISFTTTLTWNFSVSVQ